MTDDYEKESDDFLLTFAEAMAIHAFGDNLVTVRTEQYPPMAYVVLISCLLYTSPSPRDATLSRMPSSA